jgi:hypothetical protein
MASQLAAAASANSNSHSGNLLNLSTNSNGSTNQSSDLPNSGQANEMQLAQQRFMMMMFLYNQFLQAQTQSS